MILYYCCTQTNNDCPNKEKCMRYLNTASAPHATLYKYACTGENEYLLFMPKEESAELVAQDNEDDGNEKGADESKE